MKRILLLMALALGVSAGQAGAQMLFIDWIAQAQVNFLFGGAAKMAQAGAALGYLDPVDANPATNPNAEALGFIYCVDLSNLAEDRMQYGVSVHYDDTGWLTPVGDGDDLRRSDGLWRAAWLVNRFSNEANTNAKRIGLNVAIWEAAYGDYFTYTGGLTSSQEAAMNSYLDEWNGQQSMSVRWFDNDTPGEFHQDFIQGVPEPASLLLLGGGLLSAACMRRRRRN